MYRSRWFFHPITIFVFSIIALATSLILYIYWYIEVSAGLRAVVRKFNIDPDQVFEPQTWVVILVLSILVAIILIGIFIIFVYNQRSIRLYRLQHNFINSFTHELKTPVTSLKLYLETFQKHELPRKDQLKFFGYMIQDVNRLSGDISSILNLARVESKSFAGEYVASDPVQLIENFYIDNQHLFQDCDIQVHEREGVPQLCRIDTNLFDMLLMNITTNAIKYNQSGSPRLDIRFENRNRKLMIHFEDNGIGLKKPDTKKIFKKFYQVGRTDDMSARGSGFGLYLAQNIIRMHKGKITAKSGGPGKGSLFTLTLPCFSEKPIQKSREHR